MVPEYGVFSDESRHTASRFRAIAAVSLPAAVVTEFSGALADLLEGSSVTEFRWSDFQGARDRHCAIKMLDFFIDRLLPAGARVDVLVWDTQDSRHTVPGRDDRANFERMFFHLHRGLMERRELGARWHLRPDERQDLDWRTVRQCLTSVGRWRRYFEDPLLKASFSERFFDIATMKEVQSHSTPLCQLADLLAGLGPYTRDRAVMVRHSFAKRRARRNSFRVTMCHRNRVTETGIASKW